jgi:hypothetical protein
MTPIQQPQTFNEAACCDCSIEGHQISSQISNRSKNLVAPQHNFTRAAIPGTLLDPISFRSFAASVSWVSPHRA